MRPYQWLRSWLTQTRRRQVRLLQTSRPGSLRRHSVAPRLELLEDRTLPSTFLVTNLNDSGSGSLRAAVQSADLSPGSTINFARGLHGTITLTSGELDITTSVTINGPGASKLAVSGNDASRIFNVSGSNSNVSNVSISGLTITDGMATGKGGGIFNQGSTLNLSSDVLSDNQAVGGPNVLIGQGGAVYNSGGNVSISQSKITSNLARGETSQGSNATGQGGGVVNGGEAYSRQPAFSSLVIRPLAARTGEMPKLGPS